MTLKTAYQNQVSHALLQSESFVCDISNQDDFEIASSKDDFSEPNLDLTSN